MMYGPLPSPFSGMVYSRCGHTDQEGTILLTTDQEEEHFLIGDTVHIILLLILV